MALKLYNKNGTPGVIRFYNTIKIVSISAGIGSKSLGVDSTGQAWGWEYNFYGQLGDNTTTCRCTPVAVCGGQTFCQISGGGNHSIGIDHTGKAWSWGYNNYGQLGDNTVTIRLTPIKVCSL